VSVFSYEKVEVVLNGKIYELYSAWDYYLCRRPLLVNISPPAPLVLVCVLWRVVAVVGCADIVAPEGVVAHRHGPRDATITCRASDTQRSWDVSCQDDRWVVSGGLLLSSLLNNCTQLLPGILTLVSAQLSDLFAVNSCYQNLSDSSFVRGSNLACYFTLINFRYIYRTIPTQTLYSLCGPDNLPAICLFSKYLEQHRYHHHQRIFKVVLIEPCCEDHYI